MTRTVTRYFLDSFRTNNPTVKDLSPDNMTDRRFLMPPGEDGSHARPRIVRRVNDLKNHPDTKNHPELIRFQCLLEGEKE